MTRSQGHKEWTLAGAARTARDARIAAVRYMREADVERRWQASVLSHGHEARCAIGIDPEVSRSLQLSTMGYPHPYPADWSQAAAVILADEARYVAEADLYVLTPQMLDVLIAAAQTLTDEDLDLLREDDLPSATGAVVLPRPIAMRLPTGTLQEELAYTWRFPWRIPLPQGLGFELRELPAVRMSSYRTVACMNRDVAREARAHRIPLPPLQLDCIWSVPLHASSPTQARDCARLKRELRRINTGYWEEETRKKQASEVVSEYTSGEVVDFDPDGTFVSRFLYAFWRLCEQRIATLSHTEPGHSARTTAARAGVASDVRLMALRRTSSSGQASGSPSHEWHHRWVVRMHKVRQWYPSLGQHKVLYRGPYVKGPEDKPLLGGDVVRGLVR